MKTLFIDGKRSGYGIDQCGETLTVRQLVAILKYAVDVNEIDADSPIYLANDNGYTFGEITDWNSFKIGDDEISDEDDIYKDAGEFDASGISWEYYDVFESEEDEI